MDINQLTKVLYKEYASTEGGVSVNFREIFPFLNKGDRYSHSIHPYPAKLIPHIPYFFLNNENFIRKGEVVLDPFCGSGTTLLEANLQGINSYGVDSNPLARLISNCKTEVLSEKIAYRKLHQIISYAPTVIKAKNPQFTNIDMWFSPRVKDELAKLLVSIKQINKGKYQNFFLICFSALLHKVSYTDPRISVPVRINVNRYAQRSRGRAHAEELIERIDKIDVLSTFENICNTNIKRIASLNDIENLGETKIISKDARKLTNSLRSHSKLNSDSVDLVLTSPPYASAQKYIRSSSLSLYWLSMLEGKSLVELDADNIGHENYRKDSIKKQLVGIKSADEVIEKIFEKNQLRGKIVSQYLLDMEMALDESVRVLKHGRCLILVIGNNKVCGYEFNTKRYLSEYLISRGMVLELELIDDIKSYGLMTKRNKTASIITREWILVFRKR